MNQLSAILKDRCDGIVHRSSSSILDTREILASYSLLLSHSQSHTQSDSTVQLYSSSVTAQH